MKKTTRVFATPPEIVYGIGSILEIGAKSRKYGQRVMLVTGRHFLRRSGYLERILCHCSDNGMEVVLFDQVEPEPSLETVDAGLSLARKEHVQAVIGIGGGSALDVAKAIAGLRNEKKRKKASPTLPSGLH
jgi:alcohol dehydrogenase class IV